MATLSARQRKRLPRSAFAYPATRRYPIHNKPHARNALARAAQYGTRGTYQHVARAVRRRYGNAIPTVGPKRGTTTHPGYRTSGTSTRRGRRSR